LHRCTTQHSFKLLQASRLLQVAPRTPAGRLPAAPVPAPAPQVALVPHLPTSPQEDPPPGEPEPPAGGQAAQAGGEARQGQAQLPGQPA
jgi:hypothetical protein